MDDLDDLLAGMNALDDSLTDGLGFCALDEIAAVGARLPDFKFIPALSDATAQDEWSGEVGFVHEVVQRHLRAEALSGTVDAYACGPPPMIDAVLPVLQMNAIDLDHIYFDRFTPAVR